MSSEPQLILVSGANGFVATDIALAFLREGYRVRGTVRTRAKADTWTALPALAPFATGGMLDTALVPDITVPGAFRAALGGVDYFVHTVAQLPDWRPGVVQNYELDILRPNIDGTVNALRDAAEAPRVKKVIVLGSMSAVVDFSVPRHDHVIDETSWNPRDYEYGKNAPHPLWAYATSKKLAEQAAWKYVEETKPHFALIVTLPAYVYGPAHGQDPFGVRNSSQQWLAGPLFQPDWNFAGAAGGPIAVDLRDVCTAHVRAVQTDAANGQRLLLGKSHPTIQFPSDFIPLFARAFPEREGRLARVPPELTNSPLFTVDSTRSEALLGMTFRDPEVTVLETARWLLENGAEEAWKAVKSVY